MTPNIYQANLWIPPRNPGVIVVTANNTVDNTGKLIMGAGAAGEAAKMIPDLPVEAGRIIRETEEKRYPFGFVMVREPDEEKGVTGLALLQTKAYWKDPSQLTLVAYSLHLLKLFAWARMDISFRVNYPGIGNGGLDRNLVEPLLMELPENVTVVYR